MAHSHSHSHEHSAPESADAWRAMTLRCLICLVFSLAGWYFTGRSLVGVWICYGIA